MTRRIPIIATLVVLAAAGVMIRLGIWQLDRMEWKKGLIAQYEAAQKSGAEVPWPSSAADVERALFHRSRIVCAKVVGIDAIAGQSAQGQPGWSHIAHCRLPDFAAADVALGWSDGPNNPPWSGGEVTGWVSSGARGARLIASPPQAGLAQLYRSGPPDPTPTGHLFYAIQWFAFAAMALVIYPLALRKRWRGEASG